jgi:hypothetical protein
MAYDNTNRWTLGKNDRKESDNHPDYKGKLNVDGVDYWLDGWIKDGANGKFISGSIKPKEARAATTGSYTATRAPTAAADGPQDEAPF